MKSQVATILTIAGLALGTGGAIAIASYNDPTASQGGAASGQYCPEKGYGQGECRRHHRHHHHHRDYRDN
jgi:hypothetical protein